MKACEVCGAPSRSTNAHWKRCAGECTRIHERRRFQAMREREPILRPEGACEVCGGACNRHPATCARIASELLVSLRPSWEWRDIDTISAAQGGESEAETAHSSDAWVGNGV